MWAYGAAGLAFVWLAVRLVIQWHPGGKPAMLLAMAVTSAAAAASSMAFVVNPTLGFGWLVALLEFVRVTVTLGFLLAFIGVGGGSKSERGGKGWAPLMGAGALLLITWILVGVRPPGVIFATAVARQLGYGSALGVAAFGLVLVEQCYRRTTGASRWHVRPMILGMAGLFAFDVVLYTDALLFGKLDYDLWFARGFAQALTVPLILATLRRRDDWSFELSVSRGVVAGSTALLLTGSYLLLVAGAGLLLRQFGGSWGRALESVLIFAALLLLAVLALSTTFRAKVRVLVAKHFFAYRYDYREEWLRLTATLSAGAAVSPWSACVEAIGSLVESPGGALWFRTGDSFRQVERSAFPADENRLAEVDPLPEFLQRTGWVLDISEPSRLQTNARVPALPPSLAGARDAWLIVPLLAGQELLGFIVLSTPRVKIDLDWEVLDLLKTAGRQAAGYLAYARATEALLEAQKFDAFHRMSTFVVHDLKNLIAQLQLLLSNAERHRDNPDFQRDMLKTIEHVVSRMHQLTLQLRPEASGRDKAQPVDVGAIVRRVETLRLGGRSGLTLDAASDVLAWAHEDLLERVIAHLVQNGFDASEGEAAVLVRVERDDKEVRVEVSDRGHGMAPEFIRDRLFRPFQTTKATGMGIGVYECRQYIEQIGGRIEVQSVLGEGTRVTLRLRAVAPSQGESGAEV